MDNASVLIRAMAAKCRQTLSESQGSPEGLPAPLQPPHLQWMCDQIEEHAAEWSTGKLHRWIGFVQCALMANQMTDLAGLKAMFDELKLGHDDSSDDLLDHLDPSNSFRLDIGGEG